VTITLPVHPLAGQQLAVVRHVRSVDGQRRYVDAEHPRGWTIRLPVEWTDRGSPQAPPRIGKREIRIGASGLLKLAAAVEVALGEKLDLISQSEQMARYTDAGSEGQPRSVVGAASECAARCARRVGRARSQDAVRRDRRPGGKR
jgi:hypothetical protein